MNKKLPIKSFKNRDDLRQWLKINCLTSEGLQVQLYKVGSGIPSITFHELLEEGLCFGWSESKRLTHDKVSYLQIFTPRKTKGTTSRRNSLLVEKLIKENKMTQFGLSVLS